MKEVVWNRRDLNSLIWNMRESSSHKIVFSLKRIFETYPDKADCSDWQLGFVGEVGSRWGSDQSILSRRSAFPSRWRRRIACPRLQTRTSTSVPSLRTCSSRCDIHCSCNSPRRPRLAFRSRSRRRFWERQLGSRRTLRISSLKIVRSRIFYRSSSKLLSGSPDMGRSAPSSPRVVCVGSKKTGSRFASKDKRCWNEFRTNRIKICAILLLERIERQLLRVSSARG